MSWCTAILPQPTTQIAHPVVSVSDQPESENAVIPSTSFPFQNLGSYPSGTTVSPDVTVFTGLVIGTGAYPLHVSRPKPLCINELNLFSR